MVKDKTAVDRRTVLKSASAATGLALTGNVRATSKHDSVTFAEVRVEHDVTGRSSPDANYPTFHVDEFSIARAVDQRQSKVYINEEYGQEALDAVKNNDSVVAGREYASLPAEFGSETTRSPLTKLGENFRALEGLNVEDKYEIPKTVVEENDGAISVRAGGKGVTVPAGDENEFALEDREVTVELFEIVEKDPDKITVGGGEDWDKPWRKPEAKRYWTETVTLTPKVRVRNYGDLEVIGVTSVAPQTKNR